MVIENTWRHLVGRLLVYVQAALHRLHGDAPTSIPPSRSVHDRLPEADRINGDRAGSPACQPLILTIDQLRNH